MQNFMSAQDLQPNKISCNMQNLVHFSAPLLSACASPLGLPWQRHCLTFNFYMLFALFCRNMVKRYWQSDFKKNQAL